MFKYRWVSQTITTNAQANRMIELFKKLKPTVGAFDTETTGLHIMQDKPFLYQFGFLNDEEQIGYTFVVDLERQPNLARAVIKAWQELASELGIYLGHNVGFDLHMMTNLGLPYTSENISDTMFWIRHAHNALTPVNRRAPSSTKGLYSKICSTPSKRPRKIIS